MVVVFDICGYVLLEKVWDIVLNGVGGIWNKIGAVVLETNVCVSGLT
jgi:hypothetical protein